MAKLLGFFLKPLRLPFFCEICFYLFQCMGFRRKQFSPLLQLLL